jgi:hypothetical protein
LPARGQGCGSPPRSPPPPRYTCRWRGRPVSRPPRPFCSSGSPHRSSPGKSAFHRRDAPHGSRRTSCASSMVSRAGPGASSTRTSVRSITGCHPTTTRSRPTSGWRIARRLRTWGWRCSPTSRPGTSATSRPAGFWTAPRAPSGRCPRWSATGAISTTGTTPGRSRRSSRGTSRRWIAATWPAIS